jgi:hypothetical protein
MNNTKDHIEQTLADHDINSTVKDNEVKVHKDNLAKAKRIIKKLGHSHTVKSGLNEEEQIDELSKKTLGSYIKANQKDTQGLARGKQQDKDDLKSVKYYDRLLKNRKSGIEKAVSKLTKEEVENVTERRESVYDTHEILRAQVENPKTADSWMKPAPKREKPSILSKIKKVLGAKNESIKQIDELSKDTLKSYVFKRSDKITKDTTHGRKTPNTEFAGVKTAVKKIADKAFAKYRKPVQEIALPVDIEKVKKATEKLKEMAQNENI